MANRVTLAETGKNGSSAMICNFLLSFFKKHGRKIKKLRSFSGDTYLLTAQTAPGKAWPIEQLRHRSRTPHLFIVSADGTARA